MVEQTNNRHNSDIDIAIQKVRREVEAIRDELRAMQEQLPGASDAPFLSEKQATEVEGMRRYCDQRKPMIATAEAQLARYDTGEADAWTTVSTV